MSENAPVIDASVATPASAETPAVVASAPVTESTPVVDAPATDTPAVADPVKVEALKAPEKYEFKALESGELNPEVLGEFEGIARELDMSQDDAQKLLGKMAPAIQKAQQAEMTRVYGEWAESAKTDKEFGGDKLSESLALAEKAVSAFGSPELTAMLKETGLGNHPEVIRAFYKIGKQISSGSFVAGNAGTPQTEASTASKLYPNMK